MLKNFQFFSRLQKKDPKILEKIFPISGDTQLSNCGICDEDFQRLIEKVNFVFNSAASISFNRKISTQILENVGGTRNVLELAKKMKNLESFVHVSTAFCVVDHLRVEEKVYESKFDPFELLKICESSENSLEDLSEEISQIYPNNYCFTKHMAEILVESEKENLKISIARPSIVCPSYREPFPGWVDNFNTIIAPLVAVSKGILRSILVYPEDIFYWIPVDMTSNALILIAKETTERDEK